jgi:hypothetical protein
VCLRQFACERRCSDVSFPVARAARDIGRDPPRLVFSEQLGFPLYADRLFLLDKAQITNNGEQPVSDGRFAVVREDRKGY